MGRPEAGRPFLIALATCRVEPFGAVTMALKNCKECVGQVSSNALVCPHCGNQISKLAGNRLAIGALGRLAIIVSFMLLVAAVAIWGSLFGVAIRF